MQPSKASPGRGSEKPIRHWVVLAALYCGLCAVTLYAARNVSLAIILLAQIDLVEALSLYCCCLFTLALVWPTAALGRGPAALRIVASIIAASIVLVPAVLCYRRPPYAVNALLLAACAWCALNMALAPWAAARGERRPTLWRGALFLLLPLYAATSTGQGMGRLMRACSRLLSAALVAAAPLAALFLAPPSFDLLPDPSPEVSLASNYTGYQVLLDKGRSTVWSTTKYKGVYRFDLPIDDRRCQSIDLHSDEVQEVALLPNGGILFVERDELTLWVVDPTGRVLSKIGRLGGSAHGSVRPLLPGRIHDLIVDSENSGLLAYVFSSPLPQAEYRWPGGTSKGSVLHPVRDRVYAIVEMLGLLIELDLRDLRELRSLEIGRGGERMTIDPQSDLCWIPVPPAACLLAVDLERFEIVERLTAAPGVRVAAVDSRRELLVCGGFSSYVEIFDLRDRSLLARLRAAPWQRSIVLDPETGIAYINTAHSGIYTFDYVRAAQRAWEGAERPRTRPLWLAVNYLGSRLSGGLFESLWHSE
ncbi:MAG: hypothetical protein P9M14_01125 [Candidatus Alcyoniella australis]|nr:hypothetical protein [Candidatus Alcyoniella australis]